MKQVTITLLMLLLGYSTTVQEYPNCGSCRLNGADILSRPPLSYDTMSSDEYTGGTQAIQPTNDECTSIDGQGTINCRVGTTLMDCVRGPMTIDLSDMPDLSDYFVWSRTGTIPRNVSITFRFPLPVNLRRISMWFYYAVNSAISIPQLMLYSSNDNFTTQSNQISIDTSDSPILVENARHRLNVDITNQGVMIQSLRIIMTISEGTYIFLSEVLFCGSFIEPPTPTDAATASATVIASSSAFDRNTDIVTAPISSTPASDTSIATTGPSPTNSSVGSSGSSSSTNIGAVVAPIIVIILIAVVVVVVLLVIIWWRRRKTYHIYDQTTDLSRDVPYYSAVQHPSSVENEDYYDNPREAQKSANSDEKPTMVYAVPNKRDKKERIKSTELRRRSSIDFNYRPQRSPEMQVRSREQTLSLINPDYQHKMELDIYAAPDLPKRTEASTVFDENEDDPIYSEAINPSDIMGSASYDSALLADALCPYASIYADPMPLDKSEGPPIVSNKNIEILHQLGTGQFGEVILANTVGLSHQYLGIGNSTNSSISIKVAVKTLKANPTNDVQKSFEKEIKFMSRLKDDNVIRLLGICTSGTPFIMMEYMENGDLNQYLQQFEFTSETEKLPGPDEITLPALVYMSFQIASGMKYLSSHKFIHRDLATRNILAGVDYTVKIADFGMSQNLYSAYYYKVGGRIVLPIRWMAYECFFGKFSIKTDVWAYGITLWEIFTLCRHQPFYELSDQQVIENAIKGEDRMIPQQPEVCPNGVYTIMKSCFPHEPSERAGFDVLCDQLNEFYSNLL